MEYDPNFRFNISDICRDFYRLGKKYSNKSHVSHDSFESLPVDNDAGLSYITIKIITVEDAVRIHKSENGNKHLAWHSFKYHSSTNLEAKYWLGYYYYHDRDIPELQLISNEERIKIAVEIFKETADKGNPSAQLRYGLYLWKEHPTEAIKYLKSAADSGNSAAMYIIGKAYWNGGNGIEQDKNLGAEYLKRAALNDHPAAKELCSQHRLFDFN